MNSKITLKERLTNYLKAQGTYISSDHLQKKAQEAGYTAQTAGRDLRSLAEEGVLDVEYRGSKNHAFYRYKTKFKEVTKHRIEMRDGQPVAVAYQVTIKA